MADDERTFNALIRSLDQSDNYPRNAFGDEIPEHALKALEDQLDIRADDLFGTPEKAGVTFFELRRNDSSYQRDILKNWEQFDAYLTASVARRGRDPKRRFIFIKAPSSRAPLKITREMLLHILTYHQVMPSFMPYVFPFGYQQEVRDFHFMGFRSQSYIETVNSSQNIPLLGRHGRHIELCYSLKSVERSSDPKNPLAPEVWAIRQCSLHHQFDFHTEQMTWIIIKANKLIQDEVERQCKTEHRTNSQANSTNPFVATLGIHRILASWAGENWDWYINDMESSLQYKTKSILSVPLDATKSDYRPRSQTVDSQSSPKPAHKRTSSVGSLPRWFKRSASMSTWTSEDPTLRNSQSPPLHSRQPTNEDVKTAAFEDGLPQEFQDIQFSEEQATAVLLILKANSKVLADLRNEYRSVLRNLQCPASVKACEMEIERFEQHLLNVEKDLAMQQGRLEALLRVLADRKNLVQGILQFRNMQATKDLAEKAQKSAENMEAMTVEMHTIAQKTKVETVSMRIITLVTLFFLPGTFISTLMSTPIVKFDSTNSGFSLKNIGIGALELYLLVSVPLVFFTFFAWYGVSWWEKRRAGQEQERQRNEERNEKV